MGCLMSVGWGALGFVRENFKESGWLLFNVNSVHEYLSNLDCNVHESSCVIISWQRLPRKSVLRFPRAS